MTNCTTLARGDRDQYRFPVIDDTGMDTDVDMAVHRIQSVVVLIDKAVIACSLWTWLRIQMCIHVRAWLMLWYGCSIDGNNTSKTETHWEEHIGKNNLINT